jgi:serine/threonine protein kinase
LADVISQCLSTDPDDRPNFSAIVQALDALLTRLPPPVSPVAPSQCTRGDCAAPGTAEDSESRQSRWRQLLQFDEEEEAAAASSDSSSNDDADEEGDEEDTSSDSDQEDEALRLMHYNLDMASLRRIRANACG